MPGLYFDSGVSKGFENDIDRMDSRMDRFSKNVEKQGSSIDNTFAKIGKGIGIYFGAQQLLSFGKAVVETRAEFQKFGIILENTLGSKVQADNALEMVSKFAAQTPFQLNEVTDAFIKLTNQGFQPSYDELTKLGDLASSTGKDFGQLSEAILDAQTGEFERLKEFGIKASKEGDKVTFTFKGQKQQVDNTAESIREYILSLGDMEGVAGANAKIANSLTGQISNMGDAWDQLKNQLGELLEVPISEGLTALSSRISDVSNSLKTLNDEESTTLEKTESWYDLISYILPILSVLKDYVRRVSDEFQRLFGLKAEDGSVLQVAGGKTQTSYKAKKGPKELTEKELKDLQKLREKEEKDRQKAYEKNLSDFEKYIKSTSDIYEQYNKDTEDLSGNRRQVIREEYSELLKSGETYLEFLNRLLSVERDRNKRKFIVSEIETVQLSNTVQAEKDAEKQLQIQQENLQNLLKEYETYTQKRQDIENKYSRDIDELVKQGYIDQAKLAEQALQNELSSLDAALVSASDEFKQWTDVTLPDIAKQGINALNSELERINIVLESGGLDHEQVIIYQAEIEKLRKLIKEKNNEEKESDSTWKDILELMNGVNSLIEDVISNFDILGESNKILLSGILQTTGGIINLVQSVKAVGTAVSSLEKASAILAVITTALKVISSISKAFKENEELRVKARIAELEQVQAVNLALIEQNKLYAEGNEFFSDDKWGTALRGLNAYNVALKAQQELLYEAANAQDEALRKIGGIALFGGNERERRSQSIIRDYSKNFSSDLEKALAGISIKTRDRSGFANFFGASDEYDSLLRLYPQLIDANGELDTILLKSIIDTKDLTETDRTRLENLIELSDKATEAYSQFGNYIADIFGNVGDEITKAFQTMYETGNDAMLSLEESFSDMIETFTRDAIEFAFLQPYLNQLNDITASLGEKYARGNISAEQLQSGVIDSLGDFYNQLGNLQPQILEAYRRADELAAEAGFGSAFNAPVDENLGTIETDPIVVEDINAPKSTAGIVEQTITEETGSIIAGRLGALALSNERIANYNADALEFAVQNLVYMKQIKINTDFLPQIAENTKKTYQKLESI